MNDSPAQDVLEIQVENFGPIVEAKIDLRPLTVFVGPSNTGKSYLAILIYALHRHFIGDGWFGRGRFFRDSRKRKGHEEVLSRKTINELTGWVERMLADRPKPSDIERIVLPDLIADEVRSEFAAQGVALGAEILRCFGADGTGALVRKGGSSGARVVLRRRPNDTAPFEHGLTIRAQGTEFEPAIPKGTPLRIDTRYADKAVEFFFRMAVDKFLTADQTEETADFFAKQLIAELVGPAMPHLVGPLHLPAFYLPADRTGVMHTHNVVVRNLISDASKAGFRSDAREPMLSGVLGDFLEQVAGMGESSQRREKPCAVQAARIEDAILHGAVHMEKAEISGYPRFTYQPKGWKERLPLMRVSSMVSELAPVVLYLRYKVMPGDVLIVEEPEAHLHPAMQVEFTRQLAALVQSGVRVIVTTHSEWVLEELANIARRSKLPENRRMVLGNDVVLRPDQVGAWLFKQKSRPKGSIVEEVKLGDETGLHSAGYDDVALDLHNTWAEISSRIANPE